MYDAEDKSQSKQDSCLALPSIEKQVIEDAKSAQVNTWNYRVKNSIIYVPEGKKLIPHISFLAANEYEAGSH